MPRYHINEETDRVNICRAQTVESCPLKSEGGEGSAAHFDNKQDAFAYRESTLADKAKKEGNSFGTLSKNSKNEGTVSTANSEAQKKRGRKASPERLAFRDKMDANVDRFRGKFENNDVYKDLPNVKILLNEEFDNYDDKKKLHILKFALSDVSSKNAELSKNAVAQDISRAFDRAAYSGGMGASGTIAKQQQSLDQLEGHLKGLTWAAYDPAKAKAIKERRSRLVEKERNKAKSQSQYSTVNDSKSAHAAISGLNSDGFNSGMNDLVKNAKLQGSASGMFSVGKTYASVSKNGNEYKFIGENYNKDKKEYQVVFSVNGNKFQSVRNSAGNWSAPKEYAAPNYSY